ncbi:MFS transporter [Actinocatenispora rupis]|uniref:MFS transporter n=1 Tax=Actinocatenispora rupis TaxID=519421 RepID=A0A8J3NEP2_9ACTN|nr:MFS transporter [Actinocatenispora rupis]GID14287.1 MFS transporter [Actinocatenispora rupis]
MAARIGFTGVCLAYFAIILDASVLNVAVPAIRSGLGASMAGAQWVLNAYTLTLAALLLSAGALGDRTGLRRSLLAGTTLFTLASAACAVAPGTGVLVGARIVQGVGAAALLPATLALVPHLFPAGTARARATVVWVGTGAVATAVGPLVGGVLIDAVGWRAIFAVNLPVGVATVLLVRAGVAETPRVSRRIGWYGPVSAAATLGLLTGGLIEAGQHGWTAPTTLALLAGAVVAGAAFRVAATRGAHPMLPPGFFALRVRAAAVGSAGLMGFLFYGVLFLMSLYFQQARGWSPSRAGVALLPLTIGSTVGPLVLYRPLAARAGHRVMLLAGFLGCTAGVAVLATAGPYPVLAVGLLLVGLSSTMVFSALTSLLIGNVPAAQSGLASGLQNTLRQSGALIAVAVLGSLLNAASLASRYPAACTVLVAAAVVAVTVATGALRTHDAPAGPG